MKGNPAPEICIQQLWIKQKWRKIQVTSLYLSSAEVPIVVSPGTLLVESVRKKISPSSKSYQVQKNIPACTRKGRDSVA
jgi:hypothetical protein